MILLDTSVLIWILVDDRRVGPDTRVRIQGTDAVYASAISVMEIAIKSMLGKLEVPDDLRERLGGEGIAELSVTAVHAEAVRAFPELLHPDPFDRLLVAQAHVEGADLLTANRVLLGLDRDFIIDATT